MKQLAYHNNVYTTPPDSETFFCRLFPSLSFYTKLLMNVYVSGAKAKKGAYDNEAWRLSSLKVLRDLECTGMKIHISGTGNLQNLQSPCVFVGNHMSMMETVVLPGIIVQERPVTFAIKESLLEYPVFKYIMRSRNPIAVSRNNPRQDLKTVMNEGKDRLAQGISVVIFPQTTRGTGFDPKQFNSIGIKIAARAGVPVIPLALKTDAWTNGKLIKDLGKIQPARDVHFAFGAPLNITGKGKEEHQQVIDFISRKLEEWQ